MSLLQKWNIFYHHSSSLTDFGGKLTLKKSNISKSKFLSIKNNINGMHLTQSTHMPWEFQLVQKKW